MDTSSLLILYEWFPAFVLLFEKGRPQFLLTAASDSQRQETLLPRKIATEANCQRNHTINNEVEIEISSEGTWGRTEPALSFSEMDWWGSWLWDLFNNNSLINENDERCRKKNLDSIQTYGHLKQHVRFVSFHISSNRIHKEFCHVFHLY